MVTLPVDPLNSGDPDDDEDYGHGEKIACARLLQRKNVVHTHWGAIFAQSCYCTEWQQDPT